MLDEDTTTASTEAAETGSTSTGGGAAAAKKTAAKKSAAKKAPAKKAATKKAPAKKTAAKKAATKAAEGAPESAGGEPQQPASEEGATAEKKTPAKKAPAKKTAATRKTAAKKTTPKQEGTAGKESEPAAGGSAAAPVPLFQPPEVTTVAAGERPAKEAAEQPTEQPTKQLTKQPSQKQQAKKQQPRKQSGVAKTEPETAPDSGAESEAKTDAEAGDGSGPGGEGGGSSNRRRRRRGGRRRRKPGEGEGTDATEETDRDESDDDSGDDQDAGGESTASHRRRRRRRAGEDGGEDPDAPANTVTKVRQGRSPEDQITAVTGSTRLEAKKQRRREGREAGRRRAPIVSEAEFLARRESVDRTMVIRQRDDLTQIAVLEDKVLVEHYVARESQTSLIGNVYLGRVQNVLPSMEAAFIDIGKGRNAVLYAGEVNWSALGHKDGQPRKIESVLSSGQSVLVQITKDPVGHKGARLTSQVSLAGRFLVYVPDGTTSGISRKLPDTERSRLKSLLKEIVPDTAGVIVRTAAEGASEEELTRDVERLKARWEDIEKGAKGSSSGPKLLYGEPDLTLKVVRDLFTEDFGNLLVQGDEAWETVKEYVDQVAPDLGERLERFERTEDSGDVFAAHRIDEQIAKGLDRKVWLPSGGSLIIDRTEAMTVVDVNTGKFTGSGGNLEETVTKNNLEAAEEIVRQLRLRDIGGIIVVDFIDMVLESNRDLVLRRLVECLGRDRTRHQVAEVTSLGLVQMTRKRIGTGLLEAFSEPCDHCGGRGLTLHDMPVEPKKSDDDRRGGRRSRGRGRNGGGDNSQPTPAKAPSPKDVAAMARPENADKPPVDEPPAEQKPVEQPVEEKPVEQPVEEKPATEQPAPEQPAPEQPAAEEPAERPVEGKPATEQPAAPKVVTRTRRAASRPGGATTPAATISVTSAPAVAEAVADHQGGTPEPPKVVTRTRGRSASRPAGPPPEPVGVPALDEVEVPSGVGTPEGTGQVEPGVVDVEPAGTPEVSTGEETQAEELHVPVKKKGGGRKR